jgi:hypothetical protein
MLKLLGAIKGAPSFIERQGHVPLSISLMLMILVQAHHPVTTIFINIFAVQMSHVPTLKLILLLTYQFFTGNANFFEFKRADVNCLVTQRSSKVLMRWR